VTIEHVAVVGDVYDAQGPRGHNAQEPKRRERSDSVHGLWKAHGEPMGGVGRARTRSRGVEGPRLYARVLPSDDAHEYINNARILLAT